MRSAVGPLATLKPAQRAALLADRIRVRVVSPQDPVDEAVVSRIRDDLAKGLRRDLPIGGEWQRGGTRHKRRGLSTHVAVMLTRYLADRMICQADRIAIAELHDGSSYRLVGWALVDGDRLLWAYVWAPLRLQGLFRRLVDRPLKTHAFDSSRSADFLRRLGTDYRELRIWDDPRPTS